VSLEQHAYEKHERTRVATRAPVGTIAAAAVSSFPHSDVEDDGGEYDATTLNLAAIDPSLQTRLVSPLSTIVVPQIQGTGTSAQYCLTPVGSSAISPGPTTSTFNSLPIVPCVANQMPGGGGRPISAGTAEDILGQFSGEQITAACSLPVYVDTANNEFRLVMGDVTPGVGGPMPVLVITPEAERRVANRELAVAIALEMETMLDRRRRQKKAEKAERKAQAEKAAQNKQTPK
jgi:hypothetical protein